MAKKRNYENDEAFKNFRIEDYLPEMKRREPEAKASVQEDTALFPSMDEPDTPAMQDTVSDADRSYKPEIRDAPDGETAEKNAAEDAGVPAERTVARRISGKQRRLSLEEYRATYLKVPKIVNRKPVFVSEEVRDELDRIVGNFGKRGMSASGLIENLVRLHLDSYREDFGQWRKL
jgi:hypothetical protein